MSPPLFPPTEPGDNDGSRALPSCALPDREVLSTAKETTCLLVAIGVEDSLLGYQVNIRDWRMPSACATAG